MKMFKYHRRVARVQKQTQTEQTPKVVPTKCTLCEIILNVPCLNPCCGGHQNESRGDLCAYCATNQRAQPLWPPAAHPLLHSSLRDIDLEVDDRVDVDIEWEAP
jgi:hypothetical protein